MKTTATIMIFLIFTCLSVLSQDMPKAGVYTSDNTGVNNIEIEEFDFANGLFERGMYDMAIGEYKTFIKAYPGSEYKDLADYRIGESLYMDKDYESALSWFVSFENRSGNKELISKARLREGQIYFFTEDLDRAMDILDKLIKSSESGGVLSEAVYFSGDLSMKKGNNKSALEKFNRVIDKFPKSQFVAYSFLKIGDIYLKTGEYEKSEKAYVDASGYDNIAGVKEQALLGRAYACYSMEQYSKAEGLYKEVLGLEAEPHNSESAAIGLFSAYYNSGKYDKVIEESADLISKIQDPDVQAQLYYILAGSYFHSGDFERSAEVYKMIVEGFPQTEYFLKAELNMSWALFRDDKLDAGLENINAFIEERADDPEAHYLKAKILFKMGKTDESVEEYKYVLDKFKESKYYKESLYDLGWIYDGKGDKDDAAVFHRRFVNGFPDDERSPEVLLKTAQNNLKDKDYEQAESDYMYFISRFPEDPLKEKVLYQLGVLYQETDNYSRMAETFSDLVDEYPDSAVKEPALYWIGYAYQGEEKWSEAIDVFSTLAKDEKGEYYERSKEALAYSYFQEQDYSSAAKNYLELITSSPDYVMLKEIYYWTAEYYFNEMDSERSLAVLDTMKKKFSEAGSDSVVLYFTGENYRRLGKIGNAESILKLSLETGLPEEYKERGYLSYGRTLYAKKDYKSALLYLEEALKTHRDNMTGAYARFEMGNVRSAMGDHEDAAKLYMMVAILYDDADLCSEALLRAGMAFTKAGSVVRSQEAYDELKQRYPGSGAASRIPEKGEVIKNEDQ